MDGLDSAKCQKSRKGTLWKLLELLMIIRRKMNSVHLLHFEHNTCSGWRIGAESEVLRFLERERAPSL